MIRFLYGRPGVRSIIRCERGNFAVGLGLLLPLFLGALGGALDLLVYTNHKSELQDTADAAVLAAASEAGLKGWSESGARQVVASIIDSNLTKKFSGVSFGYEVKANLNPRTVDVTLTQDHYGYFYLGYFTGSPQIVVKASAVASGQSSICIIVRSPEKSHVFEMAGDSRVTASGCSAYSNSTDPEGIEVKDDSLLTTELACSAGGYKGAPRNFAPKPLTDCPTIKDPLEARAAVVKSSVATSPCKFDKTEIKKVVRTLNPGIYCGGLFIKEAATVTLNPGIYVIKDGELLVDDDSKLRGDGVSFYFVEKSHFDFKNKSSIALSAPETGALRGILMYAPGSPKEMRDFKIESRDARKLIGAVYLPYDNLIIGGGDGICSTCDSEVGAASSWTAIVVNQLKITSGATLVLNSDYAATKVPVPEGLGSADPSVVLTR